MHAYCRYTTARIEKGGYFAATFFVLGFLFSVLMHWTQINFLTPSTFEY